MSKWLLSLILLLPLTSKGAVGSDSLFKTRTWHSGSYAAMVTGTQVFGWTNGNVFGNWAIGQVYLYHDPVIGSPSGMTNFYLVHPDDVDCVGSDWSLSAPTLNLFGKNRFWIQSPCGFPYGTLVRVGSIDSSGLAPDGGYTPSTFRDIVVSNQFTLTCTNWPVETNSTVNSNLTVNFDSPRKGYWLTNSISLTNIVNAVNNQEKRVRFYFTPTLVNRTVVYPAFDTASLGVYNRTNIGFPVWTTLTNGRVYQLDIDSAGTNLFWSMSAW